MRRYLIIASLTPNWMASLGNSQSATDEDKGGRFCARSQLTCQVASSSTSNSRFATRYRLGGMDDGLVMKDGLVDEWGLGMDGGLGVSGAWGLEIMA